MTRLLLAALLSQASVDAGAPGVEVLYSECPDAPLLVPVDGGYFTPELRQVRENCKIAACEAYAAPLLTEGSGAPHPGTVIVLAAGGVVLVGLGVLLGFVLPHPAK